MNINASLIGELFFFVIFLMVPLFGFVCYKLGKKKTTSPKAAGFTGALLSLFPPFNLVFVAVLVLKSDITPKD